jgi:hypothetical protein
MMAQISRTQAAEIIERIEAMRVQVRGIKKRVAALESAGSQAGQPVPTDR